MGRPSREYESHLLGGSSRCLLGGVVATVVSLAPFIVSQRFDQLARLPENINTNSAASVVMSANAHNLWWLLTLANGRWVYDSELFAGSIR